MSEIIHFAHGNGFPSPCYRRLLEPLQREFTCCYIDKIGHSQHFPVTENWHHLVNEVINSIETQATKPVIGLGHSLGGFLTLLASIKSPELFKRVIMLDTPLFGRLKSTVVHIAKRLDFIDRLTPAARTRDRRMHWPTKEEAFIHLKSKSLFKSFTEDCLNDYIDYGLVKSEDGYSLRFSREIEYTIYRTIPHALSGYEKKLERPTVLIYGNKSNVVGNFELRYMKKKFTVRCIKTKGTHMFPMEYPEETSKKIVEIIRGDSCGGC